MTAMETLPSTQRASAALVTVTNEAASTLARLREARAAIPTASPEDLAMLVNWSGAVQAAARIKEADELFREAVETRVRAERALAVALEGRSRGAQSSSAILSGVSINFELGRIPEALYEKSVNEMLSRGLQCKSMHVVSHARRTSLKEVEAGIWRSYDGVYFTAAPSGRFHPNFNCTLRELRKRVAEERQMRTDPWRSTTACKVLEDAYAKSRRLAQDVSNIREGHLSGEASVLAGQAELKLAEAAELLSRAWVTGQALANAA